MVLSRIGKRNAAQQDSGRDLFSDPAEPDAGRPDGEGHLANGDIQRVPERSLPVENRKKPKRENTEAKTAFQVQYAPRSDARVYVDQSRAGVGRVSLRKAENELAVFTLRPQCDLCQIQPRLSLVRR